VFRKEGGAFAPASPSPGSPEIENKGKIKINGGDAKMLMNSQKRGFTLIELLVVIAIIAILAAILFPVFSRAREQARKAACLSNAKQIGTALMMYAQDWDETLPFWRTPCHGDANYPPGGLYWTEQIYPYVKNWDIFKCPSAAQTNGEWMANCYPGQRGVPPRPQNNIVCNYGFNEIIENTDGGWPPNCGRIGGARLATFAAPSETVVIADSPNTTFAPWARAFSGINFRLAMANQPCCPNGQPAWSGLDLQTALEKYARHSGGSNLIFADGHAKWYKGDQIKSRVDGGTLRICGPDLK